MKLKRLFACLIIIPFLVGMIGCSDEKKDDAQQVGQDQIAQNAPQQNQQMPQGQQMQQQPNQQQQMPQQNQPTYDMNKPGKAGLVKFLNKALDWIKTDDFLKQMRKAQETQNSKIMDDIFMKMALESGFQNQLHFQQSANYYKNDAEIKSYDEKFSTLMKSRYEILMKEMQLKQQQQQKSQTQEPKQPN